MSERPFLERHEVGPLMANAYLLAGPASEEILLVDPGAEATRLSRALEASGRRLGGILLTHAHFDHVGALADLLDEFEVPVYLHPDDRILLEHARESAAQWGIEVRQPRVEPLPLAHGQELALAGLRLHCLHTPGHAPGHIAFHLPTHELLIAGDALFKGSIGRTDLPFGNHEQLLASIHERLLTLPAQTLVLPGHGPETTTGAEARENPFLALA